MTGNAGLTNFVLFYVTVPECIEAGLGNTIVQASKTSSVPVHLLSTTALTNMSFDVIFPTDRFDTNFVLTVTSAQVLTQELILVEPGRIKLSLTLPPFEILYGPTNVGALRFTAVSNQSSRCGCCLPVRRGRRLIPLRAWQFPLKPTPPRRPFRPRTGALC